jgi:hypothetical protein
VNLSTTHLDAIRLRLEKDGITLSSLKDDLLDHLCCAIEEQMDAGLDFDNSFRTAIDELAPKGLSDIEEQTVLMLNHKLIPMKKLTYVIGLVACMMIVMGWLLSVLHWSAGFMLGTAGVMSFVFLFLPMLAISKFKSAAAMPQYEKTSIILAICSGVILSGGLTLKILHLPGANIMILVGSVLVAFGFLPFLFFSMYRRSIAS